MTATSFLHWPELLAKLAAMAAAYYVVGRLGLLLAIPPGFATAVWPPSGIALAGTLLFVLQGAGYIVDLALTVAQAERRLSDQRYGLVVADWRLPDGDGTAFADRAADLGAKTAVYGGLRTQIGLALEGRREGSHA